METRKTVEELRSWYEQQESLRVAKPVQETVAEPACLTDLPTIKNITCACGKTFSQKGAKKYCSRECYDNNRLRHLPKKNCVDCGAEFQPNCGKQALCSKRCVSRRGVEARLTSHSKRLR